MECRVGANGCGIGRGVVVSSAAVAPRGGLS